MWRRRMLGRDDEVRTYYDVLIACRLPETEEEFAVDLYFDLEMQREKNPGYPVVRRGIYYCSRMLSRQLTNITNADYGALKPVYSVWIIINGIPQILQNSRYEVNLCGKSSLTAGCAGLSDRDRKKYDREMKKLNAQIGLLHLCLVFLSEDFSELGETGDALIRYMQSVFIRQVGNPAYNPYAKYSSAIHEEVNQVMTIVGMFEERAEERAENRLLNLLQLLKEQGREEEIQNLAVSVDKRRQLEKLYAEFNL